MTTDELAELCRTSPETVRYWRHIGSGRPSFKVGRKVLYEIDAVEAWLREAQSKPSEPRRRVASTAKVERITDRELTEVAKVYRRHPHAPLQAVQQRLDYSRRTAARRVAQARARGFLQ